METNQINILEELKEDVNEKKLYNKLKIIIAVSFLFLLGIIVLIILLATQSKKVSKLNDQIDDLKIQIKELTNQFAQEIPDIKKEASYISELNEKIDKTQIQLIERDKEIQSIKDNLSKKDKEIKEFNQNIYNLNELIKDNVDTIEKALEQKDEEIELLQNSSNDLKNFNLLIQDSINNIEEDLIRKNKEIGICSNNFYLLNEKIKSTESRLNRNFAEIQGLKILESNLALFIDFNVRIKADFYIGDQETQAQLCSNRSSIEDVYDESRIYLHVNKDGKSGCVWKVQQNSKFFEFVLSDSNSEMNNWKIEIKNDNAFITNKTIGSILVFEEGSLYKYFKIKNYETGTYFFINREKKRDDNSYFIDLTDNKDLATDFIFDIYQK